MDQYRSRPKLSENFERHWSIRISGEIHMDQSLVHAFSWGNSYGPMVLKVLPKFPPPLVLVHGWLFPVIRIVATKSNRTAMVLQRRATPPRPKRGQRTPIARFESRVLNENRYFLNHHVLSRINDRLILGIRSSIFDKNSKNRFARLIYYF